MKGFSSFFETPEPLPRGIVMSLQFSVVYRGKWTQKLRQIFMHFVLSTLTGSPVIYRQISYWLSIFFPLNYLLPSFPLLTHNASLSFTSHSNFSCLFCYFQSTLVWRQEWNSANTLHLLHQSASIAISSSTRDKTWKPLWWHLHGR